MGLYGKVILEWGEVEILGNKEKKQKQLIR